MQQRENEMNEDGEQNGTLTERNGIHHPQYGWMGSNKRQNTNQAQKG